MTSTQVNRSEEVLTQKAFSEEKIWIKEVEYRNSQLFFNAHFQSPTHRLNMAKIENSISQMKQV